MNSACFLSLVGSYRKLDPVTARRWGLTEAPWLETDSIIRDNRWEIRSIVYCPRNGNPFDGMEAGCIYGAGEDGKWHAILFFALDVEKLGDRQRTFVLKPEFHEMGSGKNSDKLDAIDNWCIFHPAKVRFLVALGFAVHFSVLGTCIRVVTFSTTILRFSALLPRW